MLVSPHLLQGRPPLHPVRSLSSTVSLAPPAGPPHSGRSPQPSRLPTRASLLKAQVNTGRLLQPSPAQGQKAPGLPEHGPAPQGGSPPRALRPARHDTAAMHSGLPTAPAAKGRVPPGKSACPRHQKQPGALCGRHTPAQERTYLYRPHCMAGPTSRPRGHRGWLSKATAQGSSQHLRHSNRDAHPDT
ncbi:hypothetical protein NDU88_003506 [Pleurodeles waltl]|uniref:Uncharacterized protein n=1 Tax=Pleurodeles waltl TaxID=8319 RepID=A0AAV7VHA7_PLEWA|nr:hypothetical protein NDU88_003506 [Pleurodeles waltl]